MARRRTGHGATYLPRRLPDALRCSHVPTGTLTIGRRNQLILRDYVTSGRVWPTHRTRLGRVCHVARSPSGRNNEVGLCQQNLMTSGLIEW